MSARIGKLGTRFRARRKLSPQDAESLDRRGLLSTAHVITTDKLWTYSGGTRPRRQRVERAQESTPEVPLDQCMLAACFRELRRGVPAACLRKLRAKLRSLDLLFTLGADELEPSSPFAQLIRQKFRPCEDDALEAWLAQGIIPVMMVKNPYNGEVYPQVPAWGSYCITVESVLGQRQYHFNWTSANLDGEGGAVPFLREEQAFNIPGQAILVARGTYRPGGSCQPHVGNQMPGAMGRRDDTVAIIAGLGHDPSLNGRINSIMASIFEDYVDYNKALRRDAIIAGAKMACPPIATEYNPALETLLSKKSLEVGHFVGNNVLAPGEQDMAYRRSEIFVRTPAEMEAQRDQYRLIAATMGPLAVEQYGVSMSELGRKCADTSKDFNAEMGCDEITVRDDRKLSSAVPKPEVRHDIVPQIKANDEAIAAAFGLSLAMVNGEVTSAASGTELSTSGMNETMIEVVDVLGNFMTMVYNHITLEQDVFELLSDRVRMGEGEALISPQQLFEDPANALDVRVTYRFTPNMTLETLRFLYARGMIDFAKFTACALQMQGLSASDAATDTDPLEKDVALAVDLPETMPILQLKSQEKQQDRQFKQDSKMKEREIESAADMKERDIASAKDLAETKAAEPAAKKPKKSKAK